MNKERFKKEWEEINFITLEKSDLSKTSTKPKNSGFNKSLPNKNRIPAKIRFLQKKTLIFPKVQVLQKTLIFPKTQVM